MSARQNIDDVLMQFAHQTGLPELRLNDNELSLAFDDNLKVHFIYHPELRTLVLEAEVVDLQQLSGDLYRSLLAFNHHWPEYQLFFGLDSHRHILCLYKLVPADKLDYEQFEHALAELVSQSESWESLLSAHHQSDETFTMPGTSGLRV